jgi:hypothetical protein
MAWGKLDVFFAPKRVMAASLLILLASIVAILLGVSDAFDRVMADGAALQRCGDVRASIVAIRNFKGGSAARLGRDDARSLRPGLLHSQAGEPQSHTAHPASAAAA